MAMASDSITNASVPMSASNPQDFAKKKRVNRSAKLKQFKLDARREQWLSQVKNKGGKGELEAANASHERKPSMENLVIKPREEKKEGFVHHCFDLDSPWSSPASHTSSALGVSNASGTNSTGSNMNSSSGGSCSGSMTGEDEVGDDGCLDDWEAVADALAAAEDKQEKCNPSSEQSANQEVIAPSDSPMELARRPGSGIEISKSEPEHVEKVQRVSPACRAWKPDDAFRPESLPNLSKQLSFPMNTGRHYGCGGNAWGRKNVVVPTPSSCPICCEDLDFTDSRFLPCSCGFRLCLFCHKRILEEDGRCPGCRKQYDLEPVEGEATVDGGSLTFRLFRSRSLITRS